MARSRRRFNERSPRVRVAAIVAPTSVMVAIQLAVASMARGPVELQWRAPPECPEASAITARVDALLGPVDTQAAVASAIVDVRAEPDGRYAAIVQLGGAAGGGVRTLAGGSCTSVADAVALVVAVHVDALAVGDVTALAERLRGDPLVPLPDDDLAIRRAPASALTPTTAADARTPARAQRRRPLRGALRVGAGASFAALPGVATPMIALGGALLVGRARVQLELGWQLTRRKRMPAPDDGAGADLTLFAAAARGGWVPRVRTVEFPLLGGVEIGDMTARGFGVTGSRLRHGAWVALLAGAGIAWNPTPAFALVLDPALVIGLVRPRFGVRVGDQVQQIHGARTIGGRIGLALEVRLP